MWGTAGKVTLAKGVEAFDLTGKAIAAFDGTISSDAPIILKSAGTIAAGSVRMEDSGLVADSFTQFDVTNDAGGTDGFDGAWSYFAQAGTGKLTPLYTMGGGLKAGEPWTPYLGTTWLRPLEVNATTITPVDFGAGANAAARYAVVERFTSQGSGLFKIEGTYDVSDTTQDGIFLTIGVDGKQVFSQHVYDKANGHQFSFELDHVALKAGSVVDFVVSSGADAKGDVAAGKLDHLAYGKVATGAGDHLYYDSKGGVLYYDADGAGGAGGVAIATFSGHPPISAGDILLI